ncbi:MAG: hypothetical protein MK207_11700 [Saprospiraceae bacterium]|nr:hypothetical protein [Saprospiraceae bacterium]
MIITTISFATILILIFWAINSVEKKPSLRPLWMIIGCLMFFTGSLSLIINSVGLSFGALQWVESMGVLGSFMFKLSLIFGGIVVVFLVNHNPDAYDEYFDGNKYDN